MAEPKHETATKPERSSAARRLRSGGASPGFSVVLVEPEIPPNTGNVARLCAATRSSLHLVQPLGFRIDEHAVRRAGLDYWPLVDVRAHPSYEAARDVIRAGCQRARFWLFSGKAERSYLDAAFQPGDALVFGRESRGLPEPMLALTPEHVLGIPTPGAVRSLNLANSVAIALYEALRQVGALDGAALG